MISSWFLDKNLKHFDQWLPVFNLTITIARFFFRFFSFFGGGELDGTAEKIEVKMEQPEKIIHEKIMYINENR